MKIKFLFLALFIGGSIFSSCQKTLEGPRGPEGVQGEKGPDGERGPTGDNASDTAVSVFYSEWISADFSETDDIWKGDLDAPDITQDVLDKGDVLVYCYYDSKYYYKLPFHGTYSSTAMTNIEFSLGKITVFTNITAVIKPTTYFRYIIIPYNGELRKSFPIEYKDYYTVCEYFGIPK